MERMPESLLHFRDVRLLPVRKMLRWLSDCWGGRDPAQSDREEDSHGVTCPLNYVKTKLLVERMREGQVLSVLLDEEGARNVPQSAEQDGHEVLSVKQEGERWRVLIRKSYGVHLALDLFVIGFIG